VILRARGDPPLPALLSRDVGKGRVVVLAASTWFRWPPKAYAALWRQVLRYAASRDEERARLSVTADRERYAPGAVAVITATVRDGDLAPVANAAVAGSLPDRDGLELRFRPSAGEPGRYAAKVQLGDPGALRVAVSATDKRGLIGKREVLVRVGGAREGERVESDRDYLRHLAESTGGRVHEPGEAEELIRRLNTPPEVREATISRSLLFDGPWGFLVIFLLALLDWIARRRMKLI
jgi:hypothetical protein